MLDLVNLQDSITRIQQAETLPALHQIFAREIAPLGFDKHTCLSLVDMNNPPPSALQIFRFPKQWVERYKKQEYYKDDVVLKTVLKNTGPYVWHTLDRSDKRNRQIFAEAKEFGIIDGMTVPITLPGHYPCSINMAGEHMDMDPLSYHVLHLLAEYYLLKIIELTGEDKKLFDPPELTPREHECLIWMAKGKSDFEIGCILSISSRTVNGYIENIRKKFDVSTRTQAVALAVSGGIIVP